MLENTRRLTADSVLRSGGSVLAFLLVSFHWTSLSFGAGLNARGAMEVMESGIDMVVLGTDVRPGSDRLFLGPRVERILEGLRCRALVVNAS